ncbi:hypothetical protein T484DRAFT_1815914 [Baffinella frigidus]|nr:hypothetical protein T484DRAFT_1815914 [Cryptophyta sp. CCMP2293]
MTKDSPEFRKLFTRESILKSDWYHERLTMFQSKEAERLRKGIDYLQHFLDSASGGADWKGKQIASDLKKPV